jgi:erythromycin esterase
MGFFDNMTDRLIQSSEWKFYEIRGTIDADAVRLDYGVMVLGDGKAWVDNVSLEIIEPLPQGPEVSAARTEIAKVYARLDSAYRDKDFEAIRSIVLPGAKLGSPARRMSLDEVLAGLKSQLGANQQLDVQTEIASLEMESATEAVVRVRSMASFRSLGETNHMETTNADRWVKGEDGHWRLKESLMMSGRNVLAPTSPEETQTVAALLKQRATALRTVEAGNAFTDLEAFGKAVGDARVVALGEATHGTREIFQMKHRLLEYLVKEKGFTVFAIEANWPESLAADRYIKTGEGDPKSALAAMYFWTWQTEEVLAMVEWMRAYNQAPGEHKKLSFTSFDMQTFSLARDRVLDYLKQHAPDDAAVAEKAYASLDRMNLRQRTDPAAQQAFDQAEAVVALLEKRRQQLSRKSSPTAFRDALQTARIVVQAAKLRALGISPSHRDEMMARNVEWLLNEAYPSEKIVLWAHNGHISRSGRTGFQPMGNWLSKSLGDAMYGLGFAIHTGEVRAVTTEGGRRIGLAESPIPHAGPGTGTATLSAAGIPRFFLDLRQQSGPLGEWLREPHLFRSCGALWNRDQPEAFLQPESLSKSYDGLIFLENTEAARGISGQ